MNRLRVTTKITLSVYFSVYFFTIHLLFFYLSSYINGPRKNLIPSFEVDALAADVSYTLYSRKSLGNKQVTPQSVLDLKFDKLNLLFANAIYQVLVRHYSKRHNYNCHCTVTTNSFYNSTIP